MAGTSQGVTLGTPRQAQSRNAQGNLSTFCSSPTLILGTLRNTKNQECEITESPRVEKPSAITSSTTMVSTNHGPGCHLQGRALHPLPGQPLPMLYSPFHGEIPPDVRPGPPLAQLEAVPSRPVPCAPGATPLSGLWAELQVQDSSPRAAQR